MDLIKIQPDAERARSIVKLAKLRYTRIKTYEHETESPLIIEGYYEVIKELITAILFIDGYKTLSHKDLIEYMRTNYSQTLSGNDLNLADQLRKYRNKIV